MENTAARLTVVDDFTDELPVDVKKDEVVDLSAPHTWNQAALAAVIQILIIEELPKSADVEDVRRHINFMIDEMGHESTKQITQSDAASHWARFGAIAAAAGEKYGFFKNVSEDAAGLVREISSILVKKQRDYGHENIARFGRIGLLVRCHDKVARLENLLSSGNKPENETIVDNFIDVIGYSAIGFMWECGNFLLPLE